MAERQRPSVPISRGLLAAIASFMVLGLVLVAAIVAAGLEKNLTQGVAWLVSSMWGVAIIVDIYIAFAFIALFIGVVERSCARGLAWGVALFLTGSLAALAWLLWRARSRRTLAAVLTPDPRPRG
ncbi:hypothetical protein [Leptolyngbya sp. 7M]|uniref:hypothetical protein n=1 Tax=Leptolyngbya sp. 7M TaxID=2812896 RepID=UPI001B8B2F17|nr:hypothetical protein [Leptolyngbya sp. 7M]QYO63641.1 hypothetical protein JVX88_27790 [Leptolyngbya sp. 7M]